MLIRKPVIKKYDKDLILLKEKKKTTSLNSYFIT